MNALIEQNRSEIERLCRLFHVRKLRLFGSAALAELQPGESDVDFLVEFEQLPPAAFAECYFGLLAALEGLLRRPIDLVVEAAVRNPYFRASVEETASAVYAA